MKSEIKFGNDGYGMWDTQVIKNDDGSVNIVQYSYERRIKGSIYVRKEDVEKLIQSLK